MSEEGNSGGAGSSTNQTRSKQGIPRGSIAEAEAMARALWDAARLGAVPPEALAKELGGPDAKASGGAWRNKMALFRVFKLVQSDGEKLRLSPIGLRIVKPDHETKIAARRDAVLGVRAYEEILTSSNLQALPSETSLAATFEFTYGLSSADSRQAAKNFIESVRSAELLEGDVVTLEADEVLDEAPTTEPSRKQSPPSDESEVKSRIDVPSEAARRPATDARQSLPQSGTLAVTLDISNFSTEDVLLILTALGFVQHEQDL